MLKCWKWWKNDVVWTYLITNDDDDACMRCISCCLTRNPFLLPRNVTHHLIRFLSWRHSIHPSPHDVTHLLLLLLWRHRDLDQQSVAMAKFALQILWWANALELAVYHDGQPRTKRLTLLHTEKQWRHSHQTKENTAGKVGARWRIHGEGGIWQMSLQRPKSTKIFVFSSTKRNLTIYVRKNIF